MISHVQENNTFLPNSPYYTAATNDLDEQALSRAFTESFSGLPLQKVRMQRQPSYDDLPPIQQRPHSLLPNTIRSEHFFGAETPRDDCQIKTPLLKLPMEKQVSVEPAIQKQPKPPMQISIGRSVYDSDTQNSYACLAESLTRKSTKCTGGRWRKSTKIQAPKKRTRVRTPPTRVASNWSEKPLCKRAVRNPWRRQEDQALRDAVEQVGEARNWNRIAVIVGTRDAGACAQRWRKFVRPELAAVKKGKWAVEEDTKLRRLVREYGHKVSGMWEYISHGMDRSRNPKQCRERWTNFLDPSLKFGPWTAEEDCQLMALHEQLGNKWSKIAKQLPGRTVERITRRVRELRKKCAHPQNKSKSKNLRMPGLVI